MENPELAKIVNQYLSYWRTYIQPLAGKEPRRYTHFTDTLNEVGMHFYGPAFFLQFSIAVFQALDETPSGQSVSD